MWIQRDLHWIYRERKSKSDLVVDWLDRMCGLHIRRAPLQPAEAARALVYCYLHVNKQYLD